jgi:hypothetical protein
VNAARNSTEKTLTKPHNAELEAARVEIGRLKADAQTKQKSLDEAREEARKKARRDGKKNAKRK